MYKEPETVWEALENSWYMPQFTKYGQFIILAMLVLMVLYYALTHFTRLKGRFTLKNYIYSGLLGITAGVGVNSAFMGFIASVSQEMNLKYPIEIAVHSFVMMAAFVVFLFLLCFYFTSRKEGHGGVGLLLDTVYSILLFPCAGTAYYFLFGFIEVAYNFYK